MRDIYATRKFDEKKVNGLEEKKVRMKWFVPCGRQGFQKNRLRQLHRRQWKKWENCVNNFWYTGRAERNKKSIRDERVWGRKPIRFEFPSFYLMWEIIRSRKKVSWFVGYVAKSAKTFLRMKNIPLYNIDEPLSIYKNSLVIFTNEISIHFGGSV